MAEYVVQVACYALSFGYGGEGKILFPGEAELAFSTSLLGEEDVATTDDEHKEYCDENIGPFDVEEMASSAEEIAFGEDDD
jgi:hypothetical protein